MHTLKVGVLDMSAVDGGIHFRVVPPGGIPAVLALAPLRYQLVDIPFKLHHPMWMENDDIDLDYHVRQVQVPAPGGRRELDQLDWPHREHPARSWGAAVGDACRPRSDRQPDRDRPQGPSRPRDGVASANQMAKAIQPHHPTLVCRLLTIRNPPRRTCLKAAARDHLRLIRKLPRLVTETAAACHGCVAGPRSGASTRTWPGLRAPRELHQPCVSPGRRFATAPLALSDVKQTGKHLDVTINDVVLATAAGALRRCCCGTTEQPTRRLSPGCQ